MEEEIAQCKVGLFRPISLESLSLPASLQEYVGRIRPMVCDTVWYLHHAIQDQKKIIVEGANATMLDIDFGTHTSILAALSSQNTHTFCSTRYLSICHIIQLHSGWSLYWFRDSPT